jgi:hypothetical protein
VVLLNEDSARNQWRTARVDETYASEDGLVRRVKIVVGDPLLNEKEQKVRAKSVLERPVQKLIVLLKADEIEVK